MVIAVDTDRTYEYILKRERTLKKGDKPTIWLLKFPDLATQDLVANSSLKVVEDENGKQVTLITSGTQSTILIRNCLVGWKNFYNANGDEIPFKDKTEKELDSSIEKILAADRDEMVAFLKTGKE